MTCDQAKAPAGYRRPAANLTAGRLPFWREAVFVLVQKAVTVRCVAGLPGGAK